MGALKPGGSGVGGFFGPLLSNKVHVTNEQNIEFLNNFADNLQVPKDTTLSRSPYCQKPCSDSRAKISIVGQKSDIKFISRSRPYFILRGSKVKSAGMRLHT